MRSLRVPLLPSLVVVLFHLVTDTKADDPARLMVRPDASTVPVGGTISFFCRADGNPLPNIVWKINSQIPTDSRYITKSTSNGLSTLRIEPVTLADNNAAISCSADNGVANPVVADAVLTVINKDNLPKGFPQIDQHPTLKSVEQGRTAHVSCRVHGEPRPKVLWLRDMVPIDIRAEGRYSVSTMGNPGALMIQQAKEEDQGRYECVARNALGVIHSKAAHLYVKVRRVPPYFSMKLNKTYSVGMGGDVNLTCVAVGYPMPRVFWKKSGDVVLDDPATAPIGKNVLTLSNVEQSENFTCVAVSKLGNIEATTTVEVKALPSPPRHLKISRVTSHSVTLTWEKPKTEEPIRRFLVKYRLKIIPPPPPTSPLYAETSIFKEKAVSPSDTSYTVEGLQPFQLYEFVMQTVCDVGRGNPSKPLETQTEETAPSTPPIKVQARGLGRDSIMVKWSPSEKPNGLITAYKIYYTTQDPSTPIPLWKTHETQADELMTTLHNLEFERKYYVHVQAKNSKGSSPLSTLVTVTAISGYPAQPPLVEAKPLDARRIQLSWERPIHSTAVTGYVIVHNDTDGTTRELTLTSPHEKHLITGLQANTFYSFKVAAISSRGQGEFSEPIVTQTLQSEENGEKPIEVPSAPRNFEVILTGPNTVKLKWDPPANNHGGLMGYYFYVTKLANGNPLDGHVKKTKILNDRFATQTDLDTLEPNTEYALRMNAFNRNGDGEFTERKVIVTEGIPPKQPEIQSVDLLTDEPPLKAKIQWKRPQLEPLESPIDRYNLWYKAEESSQYFKKVINGTEDSVEIGGLWMGRVYEILLAAENREGLSVNASEKLETPIGNPDGEPLNVQYEIESNKMRISWDAPMEEKKNGNITLYKAVLTPMDADGTRLERNVTEKQVVFRVDTRKAYTFKVAAATMKGLGPFSPVLTINPDPEALVGPPTNVRVEPTSNTSVVVQWDFEAGQVDGFVIRYMMEPELKADDKSKWISRTVQSPSARHLIIENLVHGKMYGFCVMAIKNNRQGACSDPLAVVDRLVPQYMVENLHVQWKTSFSVKLKWIYDGPKPVGFYFNHTGKKEYFDQNMALKTMTTPGYKQDLEGETREYLLTNLRPCMSYTLHVGVYSPANQRQYWPQEVIVTTDPTGPPFVEVPKIISEGKISSGQIAVRLQPSSEEYGPISHYWIIVVPGNYSQDDVINLDPPLLQRLTDERRHAHARQISASPTKKLKRETVEVNTQTDPELYPEQFEEKKEKVDRKKRELPATPYVTARIDAEDMRTMYQTDRTFIIGDEKSYNGFANYPLEPNSKYRLLMRAFAKEDKSSPPGRRAPMTENLSRLHTDSSLGDPFSTARAPRNVGKGAGPWLLTPVIIIFCIFLTIVGIVIWWRRCNKKSAPRNHRHGSITKVALTGNIMNGNGPGETSKLLSSDYGRAVMNPYENMNGSGCMESSLDLYPLPASHSRSNYAPVPVPMPCLPNGAIMGGHPPIPLPELASHIERLRMNNNMGFQQEFESIETGQHFTWENSTMEINKHKNRYANVAAYDHSRVILTNLDGIPGSDYINANYIDGYEKPKAYIATQGPLPETFGDFWRMVWEEGSTTIVMLTNLEEKTRPKCDQYWPSRGTSTYDEVQVTLLDTTALAHYTIRSFRIQVIGEMEVRDVKHLQYTAWPDHGVPDHPTPFLMFLKRVKMINPPDAGPIISHCSAGIGRTGAFIVIDCMLERLRYENTVDIFGCVTALRSQRSYMVQTEDQYIFIHDAVLDAVNSGATEIPANKLHQHMSQLRGSDGSLHGMTGLEMEFRHLNTLKWANTRCGVANLPVNRMKNRTGPVQVLPYDNNRVILRSMTGIEGSDYINASLVDGYRERARGASNQRAGAYLVTQAVMENTAFDFWRMIWEYESCIIVMLNSDWDVSRGECYGYWPLEIGQQYGHLVVEPIAEYRMPQYQLREFRLSDQNGTSRTVRHFQFTEWPEQGVPRNAESFIDFIQIVHKTKAQFGIEGPITVHCSNGAGRSGVFVALAILIERIRQEHVVDVFTTVKLLRTERQNMVQDKEQYEFLYLAALEYLNSYDQYHMN